MNDREKVIKHFEYLLNDAKGDYQDFMGLTVDDGEKILALLKEQEEQIRKLTEEIEELRNKRNEVYYSGYDGSFIL